MEDVNHARQTKKRRREEPPPFRFPRVLMRFSLDRREERIGHTVASVPPDWEHTIGTGDGVNIVTKIGNYVSNRGTPV